MSPAPATTPFADDVYARLAPVATQDEALNWPLLTFIVGLAQMFAPVEDLVRASNGYPAWSQVLDVDRCPTWLLPWLGQFVGVAVTPNASAVQQRGEIRTERGFQRGSTQSLVDAVKATLTGTQYVAVIERDSGDAYRELVTVRSSEVPDTGKTTAAALAAKAAGLTLVLVITASKTYAELEAMFATYANAESGPATYAAAEAL